MFSKCRKAILFAAFAPAMGLAQTPDPAPPGKEPSQAPASSSQTPERRLPESPGATIIDPNQVTLHQTPRIMGVLPNFIAVDSNTRLPRLTTREKFKVAFEDSVDYSTFLLVGGLAAKGLHSNATPDLGHGAAGFGRYYWRQYTDQVIGTFFTEAIYPALTHEDPRYYTLGKNGFFKRGTYAISRTLITKNDADTNTFNFSEVVGDATEAGLSNLYYPASERGFGKSVKGFGTSMVITAASNVLKEFWPDIRKNLFRLKDPAPATP